MPIEKNAIMVKRSLLRPELASTVLARKARMARRQGLKPAKRPATKTVTADESVRSCKRLSASTISSPSLFERILCPCRAASISSFSSVSFPS
ncbi:MAG: hypothetical protein A4E49_01318 [Methanosaeta sp. PtaU1.Bin112]|nr:MAG: hypothetical protein A4E49_01318 [Methanosaeta sp. PtaU1.Bin112]